MATLGTGSKKESTEWDDILREKGIIAEKTPEELAKEQIKEIVEETVEAYDPHANKDFGQLNEDLEDADSDEERILQGYRETRLQQMKADAMRVKYGPGIKFISSNDWKAEVTEAPTDTSVVVHLFQQSIEACEVMNDRLLQLSTKFRSTKFVKCKASDAIKNYPNEKCPTILVYKAGKVVKQLVGLRAFSSSVPSADDIEWTLNKFGAVESEMIEPPQSDNKRFNIRRL